MTWDPKWDIVYSESWGARWPDENLVRFCGKHYGAIPIEKRGNIKVLDLGCGRGRNLAFLLTEGFNAYGIEASENAIISSRVKKFIFRGDMEKLYFESNTFDLVVDICSIQHNDYEGIEKILNEVHKMLKPGGIIFSILRSRNDTLFETGKQVEGATYTDIPMGDLKNKGITHFFSEGDILSLFKKFKLLSIDYDSRTVDNHSSRICHYLVVAQKPMGATDVRDNQSEQVESLH